MIIVVSTCYVVSKNLDDLFPFFGFANGSYEYVDGGVRIPILSHQICGYDTGPLVERILAFFGDPWSFQRMLEHNKARLEILFSMIELQVDDSIPWLVFDRAFISLLNILSSSVLVQLSFRNYSEGKMSSRCGSFYYVTSRSYLDEDELNHLSNVKSSIKKKKDGVLSWGIEDTYYTSVEASIQSMMNKIKYPKKLGKYCMEKGLNSRIDLGIYGFYQPYVQFRIVPDFFSLCNDLNIDWLDIDMMI